MPLVVSVVLAVILVTTYLTYTAGRLDRLAARVDAAWSALDAQLVRRAAAAAELAAHARRYRLLDEDLATAVDDAARAAREADPDERAKCENVLTATLRDALGADAARTGMRGERTERLLEDLTTATTRVVLARQFLADAIGQEQRRRKRWVPRLLSTRREPPRQPLALDEPTLGPLFTK